MKTDLEHFTNNYLSSLNEVLMTSIDPQSLAEIIKVLDNTRLKGNSIFVAGNGGSSSTASHFVNDLNKLCNTCNEIKFRAFCLTDNIPTLTAFSNDESYECALARQLEILAKPGDILVVFSGSGNSKNIIQLLCYANRLDLISCAILGYRQSKAEEIARKTLVVNNRHMGRIEDLHMIIAHLIAYYFYEGSRNKNS